MSSILQNGTELSAIEKRALLADLLREKATRSRRMPLSFAQQRLWFLDQLEPGSSAYNIQRAVRMKGRLDLPALRASLNALVARHESLRTNFGSYQGEPAQIIAPEREIEIAIIDLKGLRPEERETEARRLAAIAAEVPFNLAQDQLLRATLFQLDEQDHVLHLVMHHIISDGWSLGVLFREIGTLYEAFANNRPSPLSELAIQYADFAVWQRQWFQGDMFEEQLAYWTKHLAGAPAVLELPVDKRRPAVQTFNGAYHSTVLPTRLGNSLNELSRQEGATLFMTLLAAFQTLLSRHTNQEDILVGTPIANRTRIECEGLIGFFTNTLVMRTDLSGNPSFRELLRRVKEVSLEAYAHQDLPFEKLMEELNPERSLSHTPLFQVLIAVQNMPKSLLTLLGLELEDFSLNRQNSKFDLSLYIGESSHGLTVTFEYNTDLFEAATIARMAEHFQTLLEAIVSNPEQRLSELPMLTESERRQLLVEWNDTERDYPREDCIQQLFEEQVERAPNTVAVVFAEQELTYRELNRRANRVAHHLRSLGVGPEVMVGVCMERSVEMVVGLLGILKAGGAYVPLDPQYPKERLGFMMTDARISVLLTQQRLVEALPADSEARVICLDSDWEIIARESEQNPTGSATADNLAYVSFTSGSTGQPKGVGATHRGVVRLVKRTNYVDLNENETFLQLAPLSFDASTFELWGALTNGARLVIFPPHAPSLDELGEVFGRYRVTTLWLTAGLFHQMVENQPEKLAHIRQLLAGGDVLSRTHVEKTLRALGENGRLINGYGPTENTTFTCCFAMTNKSEVGPSVPIGRPVANTRVYVLDRYMQPVPIGVPGELHISGDGLARGYLNRSELTAEQFIPNPFSQEIGTRLYKTGDQVRYLADGNIEFLGRLDHQVKIRGFRIELGEIEVALTRHPDVSEAAVVIREYQPGDQRLVAYLVAHEVRAPSPNELRVFLHLSQPDYMIPSSFVLLDELPLTPSGKVDRHALPLPAEASPELEETYVAPRTPTEETLAAIWSQVLGVERVGIDDNFFDLGGHSLLATRLISQVRKLFQIELPLRSLFESPTVAALAERVEETLRDEEEPQRPLLSKAARDGNLPLSFGQQRMWFLDQLNPDNRLYTMQFAFRLKGHLNTDALQRSLNEIVRRHEALRTKFAVSEGQPMQVIGPPMTLKLPVADLRGLPECEREGEVQQLAAEQAEQPFDLAQAPLLRVGLCQLGNDDHVLLLAMHHIVSDGWSIGVLVGELAELYASFCSGQVAPLAELPIQYADYAVWQREWLQGEVLEQQMGYWREQLAGAPAVLELPTDRARPAVATYDGAHQWVRLAPELTAQLKTVAQGEGATLYMVLLAAFQVLLSRYGGQEDIVVGSPIANRTRAEIEGLIGFFVNTLVLRTDLSGNPTFRELLGRVREVTLDAYEHQDLPFEKLVEELQPERSLSHSPLFQVLFILQNTPQPVLELRGLTLSNMSIARKTSEFDLTLSIYEGREGLSCWLEYSTDLFDEVRIRRMLGHFQVMLESIVNNPEQRIAELPILSERERQQLLVEWNNTQTEYPRDRCIHELFETQVERTPDSVAVTFGAEQLTYQELNGRANKLAHYLRGLGVGPEVLVGICMERSLEMVVGLLGILKAGGAYVPLDPAYPKQRLAFMLDDAQAHVVLTKEHLLDTLPEHSAQIVCLDADWEQIKLESEENLSSSVQPENPAYVIYTSGSTGKPRGVIIQHRSLVNWTTRATIEYGFKPNDRILQFSSISFDTAAEEIYPCLTLGATLVLRSELMASSIEIFLEKCRELKITVLDLPTAFWHELTWELATDKLKLAPSVRLVIFGGEKALPERLSMWHQTVRDSVRLMQGYGPTEVTVVATIADLSKYRTAVNTLTEVPIGRAIGNAQTYILDKHQQPVPVGVSGELYIGGEGLARGYLNSASLTAERFIPNPFSRVLGARLYRTGDVARYLSDGEIEFLGRCDDQVKIRGYRVELGEIETVLRSYPEVREAVVIARGEPDKRLVGYLVADQSNGFSLRELQRSLSDKLPDYMIPSSFMLLDELPLTSNGKLDRVALPAPDPLRSELRDRFVAPRTDTEIMLAQTWEKLLDVHPIGVQDNFFELGGHSLLAVRLVSDIKKVSGKTIPLTSLFQKATIEYLAEVLDNDSGSSSWSTLVEIQSGTKWPFFCVNAPNVGALGYFALARHMDPNQSIYGLQAQKLQSEIEGERDQFELESLAKDYISAMREVQAEGPYLLGGMCEGAQIACEMARQLDAEGQKVSLLAIFDTWNLDHTSRLRAFLRFSRAEQLSALQRKVRIAAKKINLFLRSARSQPNRPRNPGSANYGLGRDLVPRIYGGTVTVFRVAEQQYYRIRDEQLGWGRRALGGVGVYFIPGEHFTIFREPHVQALAQNLSDCIQKALESS